MTRSLIFSFCFVLLSMHGWSQNVAINNTGAAANTSAMLDISSTNSGLLVPRMTTAQRTAIATPATGLFVYDTTTGSFWYFDGTVWVELVNGTSGWRVTGNTVTGTNNILGSLNAQPVRFFGNNVERMRITNGTNGEVVLNQPGAFAYFAGDIFSVYTTGANYAVNGYLSGTGNGISIYGEASTTGTGSTAMLALHTGGGYALYADATAANRPAVFGASSAATGTGVIGLGNNLATFYTMTAGSGGAFTSNNAGVYGFGTTATAHGGVFVANNTTASVLTGGAGVNGIGTNTGVYGRANNTGNNTWGGYFTNGSPTDYAYVGGRTAGTNYKINGPGTVSTIVKDVNNQLVNLYCPESPEILFQDFGQGELVNGKVHITLDPNLTKNIHVDENHPLRVIIQLEGDCEGVYVTNKTASGFDVTELRGGQSNVKFTWFISANRADAMDENGNVVSKFANVRFGPAPDAMPAEVIDISTENKLPPVKKEVKQ